MADEEQGTSTEETTEVAETTETTEETTSSEGDSGTEDLEQIRKDAKAFKDQKLRAEKAEAELKKLRERPAHKDGTDLSPAAQQRLDRIELNSLGIKNREEQDLVLGAAKRLGVDPSEAANDPVVSGKLEQMREIRKTKEATPPPTRAGNSGNSNVTRLAEKALSTGELPTDPELRAKVKAEMKRISK